MKASELEVGQWYLQRSETSKRMCYCCGRNSKRDPLLEFSGFDSVCYVASTACFYTHIPNCTGFDHKFWEQPSFLKPGWVFRIRDGKWFWAASKVKVVDLGMGPCCDRWEGGTTGWYDLSAFNWTPPHSDDVPWQETLTEIL